MKTIKLFLASFAVALVASLAIWFPGASAAVPGLFAQGWYPWAQSQSQYPAAETPSGQENTSLNWAGYEAGGGGYTSITGTWVVPSVPVANGTQADATWVGIGGVSSRDLIQGGTQAIVNGTNGVSYIAFFETLPQASVQIPVTIHSGDSVTATLTETDPSTDTWTFTFRDNTTGASYQTSAQYQSSNSSAEWIEEMPTAVNSFVPLDDFGSVSFTGASVVKNGSSMSLSAVGATPITMVGGNDQALATTSGTTSTGDGFTVTRTTLSSTSPATGSSGGSSFYSYGGGGGGYGRRSFHRTGVGIQGFTRPQATQSSQSPQAPMITTDGNGGITITFGGWQFGNFSF